MKFSFLYIGDQEIYGKKSENIKMALGFRECLGCWEEGGEIVDLNFRTILWLMMKSGPQPIIYGTVKTPKEHKANCNCLSPFGLP